MYSYQPDLYRTTYEYESKPLYPQNYLLDKTKNTLYQSGIDNRENSPPIILCETGNSRNTKTHKHRYLFYPSASRLSPFTDNNNLNIYNSMDNNNNYPQNEALNKIKQENSNINNINNKNETEKSPEKYQAMYGKSFELVKKISELVPEEKAKIKGNSDYYLNKDKDFMNIIDNQINTLTNHFQKSNFNLGYKTDGILLQNSNNNDINNNTHGQYKNNLLERINNSKNDMNNQENNNNRNYISDYKKNSELNIYNNNDINKDNNNINIEINEPEKENKSNLKNQNPNKYMKIEDNNINNEEQKVEEEINLDNNNINENGENNEEKEKNMENNNVNNDLNNMNIIDLNDINDKKVEEPGTFPKMTNQSTKFDTKGIFQGSNNINNPNQNKNQTFPLTNNNINDIMELNEKIQNNQIPTFNNKSNKNKKSKKSNNNINDIQDNSSMKLFDENNKNILSEENKPFIGELIEYQYQKGNQIYIKPKNSSDIKLNILRNKEGEIITYKGYPLLKNNKFYYDQNCDIIVYPDNEFIKGDKYIQAIIKNNNNTIKEFGINMKNEDIKKYMENNDEFTGVKNSGKLKKRWFMFPKGDGGAKAPMIKKRKKRRTNIY